MYKTTDGLVFYTKGMLLERINALFHAVEFNDLPIRLRPYWGILMSINRLEEDASEEYLNYLNRILLSFEKHFKK